LSTTLVSSFEVDREERLLTPDDFFEIFHSSTLLENVIQSRDLNEPSNIVRKEFVLDNPFRKLVPFFGITASGQTLHDQYLSEIDHNPGELTVRRSRYGIQPFDTCFVAYPRTALS